MEQKKNIAFIVVAAGRGSRAGEGIPKQYRLLAGKMVLTHTLQALKKAVPGAAIQVVIHPDDETLYRQAIGSLGLLPPVFGGATRQESVFGGLKAIKAEAPDYVLVHDAARPFVSAALIEEALTALSDGKAAVVPALAVTDTLKKVEGTAITDTIDREKLYRVQTPQAFDYAALMKAHAKAKHTDYTDDAAVFEAAGSMVHISAGSDENFKLTTLADFIKAEQMIMLQQADVRTGMGYDVHQFEAGDKLWLCGVNIPFDSKLKGHSDADVGLHALTDAILAALADGDIGTHFPPSDEQWRGAASHIFLEFARDRVLAAGGSIAHVGVCLICEKPKIGPHKDKMRQAIADMLKIPASRVSVQATTTEKLGFTGRGEGIAAQATATIRLPFES